MVVPDVNSINDSLNYNPKDLASGPTSAASGLGIGNADGFLPTDKLFDSDVNSKAPAKALLLKT